MPFHKILLGNGFTVITRRNDFEEDIDDRKLLTVNNGEEQYKETERKSILDTDHDKNKNAIN
jgi:hypothetical protein